MDSGIGRARMRLRFRGVVQGVGFRPTVFRCATGLGLTGFVQNRTSEVVAEIQGSPERVAAFRGALAATLPAAARLDAVLEEPLEPDGSPGGAFSIIGSEASGWEFPPIPPDLALCPDCTRELLDPSDRRYLHPFISCTQCGPRYSIVERTPFDRDTTAMADFPLCDRCLAEYRDPANRRFHAQALCCPECGPRLSLLDARGRPLDGDPILETIAALARGDVVAVQGLGGFHLAADPLHEEALRRLRRDKERGRKPFALMARDLDAAAELCVIDAEAAAELASPRSPILILPARDPGRMPLVSPTGTLGRDAPLHPAAPPALRAPALAGCLLLARDDLGKPSRRADRRPTPGRRSSGSGGPRTCSSATTAGSCGARTTRCSGPHALRWCRSADPAGSCPGSSPWAGRSAARCSRPGGT